MAGDGRQLVVWGAPHLTERVEPSAPEFLVSPLSFRQTNPRQGQALLRAVADAAGAPSLHSEHRVCKLALTSGCARCPPVDQPAPGARMPRMVRVPPVRYHFKHAFMESPSP